MGKFNNILINNNIDVFNEYRITDYSYPLAKVQNNENLLLGSELLYTTLYGSYISLNSKNNIDITTGVDNPEGLEDLFINLTSGHINANTKELIIRNGYDYSDSVLNLYGDFITRYSYKIAYEDSSNNEQIFDVIYYHPYINKVFIGSTDKGTDNNKYGTELWIQGRQITINSERDTGLSDSNTTEGSIIIQGYNLNTFSKNKSSFSSQFDLDIASVNSYINCLSYKSTTLRTYTNGNSDASIVILYGNNSGNYVSNDLPWSRNVKAGDIYIEPKKDLNIYSSTTNLISASNICIKSINDDIRIQCGSKSLIYLYGTKSLNDTYKFPDSNYILSNEYLSDTIYMVSHGHIGIISYKNIETHSNENTIIESLKNTTIAAYTNNDTNISSIILYGNNAGNYESGSLPWSGYSKIGDILIDPIKNLNIHSDMLHSYTTASTRIKSYNDITIESTNSYIKFEATNGMILGNNSKHYGTTLPTTNNTEGRIFFQIIN